ARCAHRDPRRPRADRAGRGPPGRRLGGPGNLRRALPELTCDSDSVAEPAVIELGELSAREPSAAVPEPARRPSRAHPGVAMVALLAVAGATLTAAGHPPGLVPSYAIPLGGGRLALD